MYVLVYCLCMCPAAVVMLFVSNTGVVVHVYLSHKLFPNVIYIISLLTHQLYIGHSTRYVYKTYWCFMYNDI